MLLQTATFMGKRYVGRQRT